MADKQGRKIAIVGGNGSVGPHTIKALLSYGIHTVTAISRTESTATFPAGVIVKRGSYDDEEFLLDALKGQDVLIVQIGFPGLEFQVPLFNAAAKAGVPYVVPCEFSSDVKNQKLVQEVYFLGLKDKYRNLVQSLGVSSWIGVVNNPWFHWCFYNSAWGFDLKARRATVFEGDVKFNTTTLSKVGRSLAAVLTLPDSKLAAYKNSCVYFSSFLVSHRDVFNAFVTATGTKESEWTIEEVSAEAAAQAAKEAIQKGEHQKVIDLLLATLSREGFGGNYESKVISNELLGLEEEDLEKTVKDVVDKLEVK